MPQGVIRYEPKRNTSKEANQNYGARAKDYGDAYENHEHIAKMWSVLLNTEVTVIKCINVWLLKLARLSTPGMRTVG